MNALEAANILINVDPCSSCRNDKKGKRFDIVGVCLKCSRIGNGTKDHYASDALDAIRELEADAKIGQALKFMNGEKIGVTINIKAMLTAYEVIQEGKVE